MLHLTFAQKGIKNMNVNRQLLFVEIILGDVCKTQNCKKYIYLIYNT